MKTKNDELRVALEWVNADKVIASEQDLLVSAEADQVNKQAAAA